MSDLVAVCDGKGSVEFMEPAALLDRQIDYLAERLVFQLEREDPTGEVWIEMRDEDKDVWRSVMLSMIELDSVAIEVAIVALCADGGYKHLVSNEQSASTMALLGALTALQFQILGRHHGDE